MQAVKLKSLKPWFKAQEALILDAFDNVHIVTGEEGNWKSLWMRKCAKRVDPKFTVEHIHFTQPDFLDDAVGLEPGRALILDEFRAHKRLAMHGERQEFLDFLKECREMALHVWIGYPRVTQIDNDIMERVRWWEHKPKREVVEIRQRVSSLAFDQYGKPAMNTSFPHIGSFPVTGDNDPFRWPYQEKKVARMRDRAARFRENHEENPAPRVEKVVPAAFNPGILAKWADLAQAELKKNV